MADEQSISSGEVYQSDTIEVKASEKTKQTLKELQKSLKQINEVINKININLEKAPTHLNKLTAEAKKLKETDTRFLAGYSRGSTSSQTTKAALQHYSADLLYSNPAFIQSQLYSTSGKITKANRANYIAGLSSQLIGSALGTRTGTLNQNIFGALNESTFKDYKKSFKEAEEGLRSMFYAGELGSQKFNKAMKNLSRASEKYILPIETSLKSSAQETAKNAREMERWARISDGSLALIQTRLLANYTIINSVSGAFKYLLGYVIELDKELRNLQAITGVSENGLKSLKTSIVDTANATRYTSLEVAKAATILGQAGLSVDQIKETLKPIAELATASGTELTTATEVITSTLNVYELQMSEAARVTNALTTAVNESKADIGGMQYALQYAGKSAADLGISFEETAAAVAAMTQAGIKSRSTLGTGLRSILVELVNPTAKLQKQLQSVGLTLDDIDVRALGFTKVLRNLRDAGFGVAEAYAGMERRSASALTALMSQVDFMDELRVNMNGSSAAIKGNLSQMQAFANVIDNTKSIVGSATSDALEPYLRVLTSLFKTINEGINSMNSFTKSLVFGGTILAGLTVSAKAFYGIIASIFKLLGKKTLLSTLIGGMGLKGIGVLTVAIAALGYGIDKLISSFYEAEMELDKFQSKMEDIQGEVNRYQESYNSLSNMMDRALQNRDRLFDAAGKPTQEFDIFMNEMISRFPQVNDILSQNISSFEELVKVINEARLEVIKLAADANKLAPLAANQAANVASRIYGESVIPSRSLLESYAYSGGMTNEGLFSMITRGMVRAFTEEDLSSALRDSLLNRSDSLVKEGLISPQEQLNLVKSTLKAAKSSSYSIEDTGKAFGEELKKILDERFVQGQDEQTVLLRQISHYLANPKLSEEEKQFFNQYAELIKATQQKTNDEMRTQVAEVVNRNMAGLTGFRDRITSVTEQYKELEAGEVPLESISDYVNKTDVIKQTAQEIEQDLKDLPSEIYGSEDWSKLIEQGIKPEAIRYEISKNLGSYYQSLISETRKLMEDMTKDSEEVVKKTKREELKAQEGLANTLLRSLGSTKSSDLESNLNKIIENYNRQRALALKSAKQEVEKLPGSDAILEIRNATINAEYDEKIQAAKDAVNNVRNSIEAISSNTESYFRSLQTANDAVASEYERAINKINSQFMYREGLLEGLSEIGRGDSQLSEYIRNKIIYDKREGLLTQKALAEKNLTYYQNQRDKLLNSDEFEGVVANRKKAELAYTEARNNLDKYSKNDLDSLKKSFENASRSEQRYVDVLNELQDKIVELKDTINKLRGNMDAENKLSDSSIGEVVSFGAKAGAYNYLMANNSAFPNAKQGMFELTAAVTNTGLSEMENQFASLFRTIQDGSTSAKDAFRNFTTGVLQAMADVVYSEVAKSMMKLLVGMFRVDSTAPMGDTISLSSGGKGGSNLISSGITSVISGGSGLWDGITSIFGFAQGGLVRGPVKNRDSVLTKLMPGEFVMTKQATDALGTDFLNNLNQGNAQVLGDINNSNGLNGNVATSGRSKESIVNVWVVSPDQVPASEGPNDVIAQVTQNIRTNGSIKKLIKQVSTGAI